MRSAVTFQLNGQRHEVGDEKAGWMLADYLRYERRLVGTKIVCAEGDCGACSVLLKQGGEWRPVNSCILTVAQLDGANLVTVDALADREPHPAQEAMMRCHGSQCGFCTPGFVVALASLAEGEKIDRKTAKNALTGNLCRCTGYEPIIEAAVQMKKPRPLDERFPPVKPQTSGVEIETPTFAFFAPRTLKDASRYLKKHKDARIVGAATDLGVVHNKRKLRLTRLVSLHLITELSKITASQGRMRVGARVTLTELRRKIRDSIPELARFLDLFASPQIKNVATLVGNVCNASPIADTPPFLLTAQAKILTSSGRKIPIETFYKGYRKTALKPGELVTAIEFEIPAKEESLALYKISQRKDLDISTVNAAFRARWNKDKSSFRQIRIAMGGMAATPIRLPRTEKVLSNPLTPQTIARALETFHAEMKPISDLRGSSAFRRVASENLFHRFFREHGAVQ
jgi:xanthine dehydrogenase small subunit